MRTESGFSRLTLYSRARCHLCDEMVEGLRGLQHRFRFDIAVVDVDSSPELQRRYGDDVPVLMHDTRELCRHRLDAEKVADYLAKAR
jgi:hypothetical protein